MPGFFCLFSSISHYHHRVKVSFNRSLLFFFSILTWGLEPARAAGISMKEVMESFLWAKVGVSFPAEVLSESQNHIGFRVFDEHYSITRIKSGFRVQNSLEQTTLQTSTIEKISRFVIAQKRAVASLNEDQLKQSIQFQKPDLGYQWSNSLFQCSSDLPVKFRFSTGVVERVLSHTWLQNGAHESFGMPFTDESTYFGGSAHIRSPDSFIERNPKHLKCSPVWVAQDESRTEANLSQKAACIARKMSMPQDPIFGESLISEGWVPHLEYHVFLRNCLKAVRFMLECADAKAPLSVNWGIGGSFDWNEKASVSYVEQELRMKIMDARNSLESIRRNETMENFDFRINLLLDHANQLDAKVRGQSGHGTQTQSFREICNLFRRSCDEL